MKLSDRYEQLRSTLDELDANLEWAVEDRPIEMAGTLDDGRPFRFGIMKTRATLEVGREYPDITDKSVNQKLAAEFERAAEGADSKKEALQNMADVAGELNIEKPQKTGFHWQDSLVDAQLVNEDGTSDPAAARAFRTLHEQYDQAVDDPDD